MTLGAGSNAVALTVPADKKGEKAEEVTITIDAPADVNVRVGSQELGKGRVTLSKVVVGDEISRLRIETTESHLKSHSWSDGMNKSS